MTNRTSSPSLFWLILTGLASGFVLLFLYIYNLIFNPKSKHVIPK